MNGEPVETSVEETVEPQAAVEPTATAPKPAKEKKPKVKKPVEEPAAVEAPAEKPAKTKKPETKKPAAKKVAAKKSEPKKAEKAAPKKERPVVEKKDGLSRPQTRVLTALSKAKHGLTRKEIAERSSTDAASLNSVIGCIDEDLRATPHFANCLLNKKFVKMERHDVNGRDTILYFITASGRKAVG